MVDRDPEEIGLVEEGTLVSEGGEITLIRSFLSHILMHFLSFQDPNISSLKD